MTQQDAAAQNPTPTQEEASTSRRWTLNRIVMLTAIGIIALIVLIFVIGLVAALVNPQGAQAFFAYLRDLMLIVLAVQGILIVTAVAVVIVQVARFVNLLRSEVKPITDDTREAINNVRVTTHVVRKGALEPLLVVNGFFAGLLAFLREFFKIRRLIRRPEDTSSSSSGDET